MRRNFFNPCELGSQSLSERKTVIAAASVSVTVKVKHSSATASSASLFWLGIFPIRFFIQFFRVGFEAREQVVHFLERVGLSVYRLENLVDIRYSRYSRTPCVHEVERGE